MSEKFGGPIPAIHKDKGRKDLDTSGRVTISCSGHSNGSNMIVIKFQLHIIPHAYTGFFFKDGLGFSKKVM